MLLVFATACVLMLAFNAFVAYKLGISSFFPPFSELISTQLFTDLVVSASVAVWLIARDRKASGRSLLPVALLIAGVAAFGSPALLFYLVLDEVHGRLPRPSR